MVVSERKEKVMFKKLFALVVLALACGGTEGYEYDTDPATGEVTEIGTVQEGLSAKLRGPIATFGTRTGNTAQNCTNDNSAQTCTIPATKSLRYSCECLGCGATDITTMNSACTQSMNKLVAAGLNTWGSPTLVLSDAVPPPQFVFKNTSVGGVGGSSIQNYVTITPSLPVALTETAGVVGNYQKSDKIFINVDMTDAKALGTTSLQKSTAVQNMASNGLLKAMGIGGFTADNFRCTSAPVPGVDSNKINNSCVVASSEICVLNSFSTNITGSYSNQSPNCGF
jgi:hypothetical protein